MWVLVVVMDWWATVVHFWTVIAWLRVPVRRPVVSVFVVWLWLIIRFRFMVWCGFMIWFRFMISWCWLIIGVRFSIMFNLVPVVGSL